MNTSPASTTALPPGEYAAVFQDALGLDEISLVPRGANQGADVLTFKSDEAHAGETPLARMRAITHRVIAGLSALVQKHDIPQDESAPILAGLESAAIIGAVATEAPADETPIEAPPAGLAPVPLPEVPPTLEGEPMSATTELPPTPAAVDVTAETVAKMDALLTAAVAKADAADRANALLSARVEKMEAAARDESLAAETHTLFAGVPGDRTALKAIVAKLDASDKATLVTLLEFTRAAAQGSQMFGAIGTVAKSGEVGTQSSNAFDAKVDALRTTEGLTLAHATVKAASQYPALANAVAAENRARVQSIS